MPAVTLPCRWDIFCAAVDNYGDIGVAWRLARQLAAEHGLDVRLYCDALSRLADIARSVDASLAEQTAQGVVVRRWNGRLGAPPAADADVVIEMFGCGFADAYLAAMAQRSPPPVWINLEYLSAEAWVEAAHRLASRHPRLPLERHFFFPGFTSRTGGLLRERDLFARRDAFRADRAATAALWRELGLATVEPGTLAVSLFCYANPALPTLLDAWAGGSEAVLCVVPQGVAVDAIEAWAGAAWRVGDPFSRGSLTVAAVPFVAQDVYDRILWACDFNFVRGEDSFVRAQWAARPLIWNIYPQAEDAHRAKLEAFIARYSGEITGAAAAYAAFSRAWNGFAPMPVAIWRDLLRARMTLSNHASEWAGTLARQRDLAGSLVSFVADKV